MYLQIRGTNVRLLGSMHLFPAPGAQMPSWALQAYAWSECLIFESDPPTILPFLKSTNGTVLANMLPTDVWTELQAAWPTNGRLPPLSEMRPWAALMVAPSLYQHLVEGVEPQFLRSANEQSKSYRFLETAQEVVTAFESVALAEIQTALNCIMSDSAEPQRMLVRMYNAWQRRDIEALYKVAGRSPILSSSAIRSAVLESRNLAWVPSLLAAIESPKRTLVVIGALHLCGPSNLLECLGLPLDLVATLD
ncbi:TraB/GumN family protein [Caballeronia sp. SEWSISQ10-4 2]|uniref:TraB/GumN family protein n=1 Tax=Caballeronia sp. SEWSISQ10-4 2 TaxID=2937438 RepID=UPI00265111F8|nr:TraB/GumN family protein [Caballeronia sp. SEWSISQ10-4 2]MDN7176710.1 TraB/GumN family protein [Caballeronia sp. SEWSISQ10-4 2]